MILPLLDALQKQASLGKTKKQNKGVLHSPKQQRRAQYNLLGQKVAEESE